MIKKQYKYYIGIDTGVNTGFCVWRRDKKAIIQLQTLMIHEALEEVREYHRSWPGEIFVRVEDARLRKHFGKEKGRAQLQGAGSIKRDASMWEGFLKDIKIDYELVAPKNNKTKTEEKYFKQLTGYTGRCSTHARDAAMLVFGL